MDSQKNEKVLIIVESPTKARTIKKFLPGNYTVVASNGHVRDLPSDRLGIDVKKGFKAEYEVVSGKGTLIKTLKADLKSVDRLLLATDEDREGESISWHLLELLKPSIPYQRMVFHEITKRAILNSLDTGRKLDMYLVHAQEARRKLDRLFGFELSPVLWKKLSNKKLSAGRVQSPGLRLIVERERERIQFVSSTYWDAKATLYSASPAFTAKLEALEGRRVAGSKDFNPTTGAFLKEGKADAPILLDADTARDVTEKLRSAEWTVAEVVEKPVTSRPAPPFITSTLQQEGNRKLHLSAKQTMTIAQKLYENGFITYMRTDSPSLSQDGIEAARKSVDELYGNAFLSDAPRQYAAKSASAQEAHEAIRPAGDVFIKPDESGLHGKDKALYEMIWKRTLASQMAEARKSLTSVRINAQADGVSARFVATGTQILFPGFIRVYVEGSDDPEAALEDKESFLPVLKEGQKLDLETLEAVSHETKAPARFTEASLVQQLEKMGIGRPSTYATIIDKLFDRSYVQKDGSALVPTFVGFSVVQLLEKHFDRYVDYSFTSGMEEDLDGIAAGKIDEIDFLTRFASGPQGLEAIVAEKMQEIVAPDAKKIDLPQLTGEPDIFIGPYGPYIISQSDDNGNVYVSLPRAWIPADVTKEMLEELLEKDWKIRKDGNDGGIGTDPRTGKTVFLISGRNGDFWQLGERVEGSKERPRTSSVPKGEDGQSLETALRYLALPRELGSDPATSVPVSAGIGKFGPYVTRGGEFRSLRGGETSVFTVTLEEALALLAQPKSAGRRAGSGRGGKIGGADKTLVLSFGDYKGEALAIHVGRYGYYLKHGKKNYQLPEASMKKDEAAAKTLTEDQARAIVDTKA
ncbi:type I DNA topoisomerase [Parasphaerochaeta coccoides]|uniref:DNA topoisomerase 1 n=1 Tax=Parasphaerochaeta coccoides (strain ATCC BAA-1237 / DSM 17374 / SPN1) TaxID=760011 RepID=F4GKC1_PARC1|nr:type I DNA topoisomerase [Parasphaerochaeta coccoides]AEC02317.1 DNA topoisomerase I [Parasphaerochaeta coccoides DSM 17374]